MSWLIISIIILLNSVFVIAEVGLLTSNKMKLQKMDRERFPGSSNALRLIRDTDKFLSGAQIGITFFNIILGYYSGSAVADDLTGFFHTLNIHFIKENAENISNIVIMVLITYITVLAEVIPKRIATFYPEKCAALTSWLMLSMIKLCSPFIMLLSVSSRLVLKILNLKDSTNDMTVDEFKLFINHAENIGTVEKMERDIIRRLIHLGDMSVGAIMTYRNKIVYIDVDDSEETIINKVSSHKYAYFPVINKDINKLLGIVASRDILHIKAMGKELDIHKHLKEPVYVPELSKLTRLVETLKTKHSRLAVVTNEYGDIEGLVALNDVLKAFMGDLFTLIDGQKPNIIAGRDGGYIMSGTVLIEEVMEVLDLHDLPGDEEEHYRTLAGFILKQLSKVPILGDKFVACGWEFTVRNMENFRIDKVTVKKAE